MVNVEMKKINLNPKFFRDKQSHPATSTPQLDVARPPMDDRIGHFSLD
jgi:hypothetical protein